MTAAEPDCNDPYIRFLSAHRNKIFHCQNYPGNAGDALIYAGTRLLLEQLGIATTKNPQDADVILIPGGNPSMWPGAGARFWRTLWEQFPQAEFVVGPAGFNARYPEWKSAISDSGFKVSGLFAREPSSYQALLDADLPDHIELGLSHDPALNLRSSEWLQKQRSAARSGYALLSFRDDHEGNLHCVPLLEWLRRSIPGRVFKRLSRALTAMTKRQKIRRATSAVDGEVEILVRDVSREDLETCARLVRTASEVHTDRLHIMLLAAMLGKPVVAYPTSHQKLETVYKHSVKDWAEVKIRNLQG